MFNPVEFEPAIEGCRTVFHASHPVLFGASKDQLENLPAVVVEAVRTIAASCIRSGSVQRLIYIGSVTAMSLLKKDGTGYRSTVLDESVWTLDPPISCSIESLLAYTKSKTLAEKEVLKYNEMEDCGLEVVSLNCAMVAGETILSDVSRLLIAPILGGEAFSGLKLLQDLLGMVPLVHIDDACEALIFSAEQRSMKGRFLCSAADIPIREISAYFQENYPKFEIAEEFLGEPPESRARCDNSRLIKMGFRYKYDLKEILDDSVRCAMRLHLL
ncbi:hypothetical protein SAY86_001362 [Trapa natans]|uniref:NAD-dependent epimerase/dehydratase domain-containing protein n=1 Tax=Trapa natans TaxID=22666 RepID=A0AAN7MDF4_TRANT|nr:hypothetical protein SAY86_001362 [Trapa natans]